MQYDIITLPDPQTPNLFWSTFWSQEDGLGDWRVAKPSADENPGGLDASDALASAVILSLFTDKRAPEGWRPEIRDRRGWWGDGVAEEGAALRALGSHLWLLRNETATEERVKLARLYAREALAWMVDENVVARVDVETGLIEQPRRGVWISIDLFARDGVRVYGRRFERFWREV